MSRPSAVKPTSTDADLDVLVVGAGISGIDAAYHLTHSMPGLRFALLDSKPNIGGTWHTHTFPGIRSDSDLFTFGFKWKPWTGAPIATAAEILAYLNEAIHENHLRQHIRFGHTVTSAEWHGNAGLWTVTMQTAQGSETLRCRFLWLCSGYYRHSEGYQPQWPGMKDFSGQIVHPQTWPVDLDHDGKRVVVIGSGATAATLIPALSETAQHVTMLQRSPTYYYPRPATDDFIDTLRALGLPAACEHEILRRKYLLDSETTARRSREEPDALAADLIGAAQEYLGPDYDVATHFTPSYRPWRQRVAVVPDGDLFLAIRAGKASVVTDTVKRFTPDGLDLASGATLDADIIVTATGLVLNALGDISFRVDDKPIDISQSWTHRGVMLTGLPNLAMVFGYLRSSWTLRADMVSAYVCRLLDHMQKRQAISVVPALPPADQEMAPRPWIDPDNFNAGYVLRGLDLMPKQGDRQPWLMTQDYYSDRETLPAADLEDGTLRFSPA